MIHLIKLNQISLIAPKKLLLVVVFQLNSIADEEFDQAADSVADDFAMIAVKVLETMPAVELVELMLMIKDAEHFFRISN